MAVSLGLIGVGGIGSYHLHSMRNLAQRGLARPVAVVEPMIERFSELKRSLEAQGVRWYLDYREMLRAESELDAVTIATPIPLHFEMTRACLDRGVFVTLEKPPVPLVQQLETLIALDKNRQVAVGFQMILSRCMQRMKQLLTEGAVGEVRSIRACGCWPRFDRYYRRTNWAGRLMLGDDPVFDGPATNALAHLVHHIMFLASPDAAGFAFPITVLGELYRARPIESYDVSCVRGAFASGIDFSLAVTHATQKAMPFKIEVHGDKGWLRLTEDGERLESSTGEQLVAQESTQQLLDGCYEHFMGVLQDPARRPYTTLEDTVGYVRTTNGLFLSSGGVHDIGARWVKRYGEGDEAGYDVRGLHLAVEQVFATGQLFSELGHEWAIARPVPVRLDSFHGVDLAANALRSAD